MKRLSMKRLSLLITAFTLLAVLPLAAQPARPGMGGGMGEGFGPPPRVQRALAAFLELSEEQIEAARGLREEARAAAEPLAAELKAWAEDLRSLLDEPDPDPLAVGEAVVAIHDLKEQLRDIRETFEADFRALLTPEQVDRYEAFRAALRALRRGPRGHGSPGGSPPQPGGAP